MLFHGLAHASARALLAWVCTDADGHLPDELIAAAAANESEARWLTDTARRIPLAGLLWSRLTAEQRELLPPSAREALADAHLGLTLRGEALHHLLARYITRLNEAGIPVLLLKGAALMQTVYADPADRVMRDLDLLVPDEKLEQARAMVAEDATEVRPDRPGLRHLGTMLLPGEYTSIELHSASHHVEWWPQLEPGDPFKDAEQVQIGQATAYHLGLADSLLHIACHGVRHSFSDWPIMAADLSRLLAPLGRDSEWWEAICRAAQGKGRQRSVLIAVAFASGGPIPPELRDVVSACLADEAEKFARIAWRITFEEVQPEVNCWHRAWVRDSGWPRLREVREYVLPRLWRVSRRFETSAAGALAAYPWYAMARAGRAALTGWRWRSALRRYR